jgi:hypothetical protein
LRGKYVNVTRGFGKKEFALGKSPGTSLYFIDDRYTCIIACFSKNNKTNDILEGVM